MLRWGLALAATIILLDQLSKWVLLGMLARGDEPIAVTAFFNLVMVWNRGVSFGLFDRAGALAPWVLSGLALAVVVALIAWLSQTHDWLSGVGLGLVIGGALGNVIDRVRLGAVVDFLDFHLAGWHWPAFNLADSAICVGAALLVADGLLGARRRPT